ncbi:hypothetical protein NU08_0662 [Flavobacterium anhuiense]|uniref:Uncharacterized protein n=1 Tax=Flavobacterium anhuiense TaxID=459526 RepID=A0A444W2H9_9FLAO|nr:hypothetical protein NU08_0662 [Flavobacterium anhuiense]
MLNKAKTNIVKTPFLIISKNYILNKTKLSQFLFYSKTA